MSNCDDCNLIERLGEIVLTDEECEDLREIIESNLAYNKHERGEDLEIPTLKAQGYILEKTNQILRIKTNSYDSSITLFNEKGVHHINIKGKEKGILEVLSKRVKYLREYQEWKKGNPEEWLRQEAY